MAGVPNLRSLSDTYNLKAQAAALMMSVNRALSHSPPSTWICYTPEGAQGAGSIRMTVEAEKAEGFDPAWLRNAVLEPLEEADVVVADPS